jgi:drug/metabolite transporter (DMT)-like permease
MAGSSGLVLLVNTISTSDLIRTLFQVKPRLERATDKTKGGLRYMVAAAFFFSLMSLFVKLAGRRLPTTEIVMARSVIMLVISFLLVRRVGLKPWGTRKGLLTLRGLVGFCALLCFFFAVTRLPLADVTVIHFTNPVFTALFASLFLHESMRRKEIAGLVLGIIGVLFVARPSFLFGQWAGDLELSAVGVAMTASVLSATAYVTIRKLRETEHYLVIVFYFSLVSTAASVPLAAGNFMWPTPSEWALLIGVGIATQTAQIFLTKGLLRERAGRAMSISYVQVLFAAVWGMIVFGDQPGLLSIGGAALVFLGTLLVARKL